ncbi:cytochrome c-type biogenesis protein CcmH [Luteimonas yindakuii]|uniref:Cytochrome c-type biogenesis protein n=1 Tax=Luteimonas yindakuii TaxID=2565782 RepID=A0A4Z1R6M7_9GAMM|nr:cytochrome c-type biogenesis protein [Luteimonas yindakuii]QCO67866.1 cytochrome c-type biogenesis protein CcmH [Luteimonas yindakuii]TKS54195.1 cytochrome c-type biogenesis protein CcmH [Luteimonas yindakuii]
MRTFVLALLWTVLFAAIPLPSAHAQAAQDPTPLEFVDPVEEKRFRGLIAELRCVMCQNQSLADSNAQIAHDLRREVLVLMRRGLGDAEIRQHLVDRYGEFVLYRPRVGAATFVLWFGPALLLLGGGVVVWRIVRSRSRDGVVPHDDTQEW